MSKMLKCKFDEIIMITGKKFAENVINNEINYLSLMVNCFYNIEKIMDISFNLASLTFINTPSSFKTKNKTVGESVSKITVVTVKATNIIALLLFNVFSP